MAVPPSSGMMDYSHEVLSAIEDEATDFANRVGLDDITFIIHWQDMRVD